MYLRTEKLTEKLKSDLGKYHHYQDILLEAVCLVSLKICGWCKCREKTGWISWCSRMQAVKGAIGEKGKSLGQPMEEELWRKRKWPSSLKCSVGGLGRDSYENWERGVSEELLGIRILSSRKI